MLHTSFKNNNVDHKFESNFKYIYIQIDLQSSCLPPSVLLNFSSMAKSGKSSYTSVFFLTDSLQIEEHGESIQNLLALTGLRLALDEMSFDLQVLP